MVGDARACALLRRFDLDKTPALQLTAFGESELIAGARRGAPAQAGSAESQGIEEYQVGGHSLRHGDSGHAKVRDALPSAEGLKGRITRIRAK